MTTNNNNTIYDDVFKTMLEKFPELIIPLVNEEFHKNYPMNAKIESLNLESHKEEGHVIADSVFKIENNFYHVECQSNIDNTVEEIFEKKLFMLLPFYIMRYEKTGNDIMEEEEIVKIVEEYKEIVSKMEEAFYSANDIDGKRLCAELQELMKRLAEYIFQNNENAKRDIGGAIMGGTAFKTLTERLEESEEQIKQAEEKTKQAEEKTKQAEAENERLRKILAKHGLSDLD